MEERVRAHALGAAETKQQCDLGAHAVRSRSEQHLGLLAGEALGCVLIVVCLSAHCVQSAPGEPTMYI